MEKIKAEDIGQAMWTEKSKLTDKENASFAARKTSDGTKFEIYESDHDHQALVHMGFMTPEELADKMNKHTGRYIIKTEKLEVIFDSDIKEVLKHIKEYKPLAGALSSYNREMTQYQYAIKCIEDGDLEKDVERGDQTLKSASESYKQAIKNAIPIYMENIKKAVEEGRRDATIVFCKTYYPTQEELDILTGAGYDVVIKVVSEGQYTTRVYWTNKESGGTVAYIGFQCGFQSPDEEKKDVGDC